MKQKSFIIYLFMYVVLASSCQHAEKEIQEAETFEITSALVTDTVAYKSYVCQIKAIQHIEMRALEKGYLQSIYVDEGQHVKKGALMFRILPTIYEAELQKARAEANYTEIEYQNTKLLADSNIVSVNELALSRANYDRAKAEVNLAQTHLSFTEIRAPFDGIMDHFHVRLGSMIDEGELLTTLSDNNKMWVYFNVPEAEYLSYASSNISIPKTKVKLITANNEEFASEGEIETIEADFDNETGTIAFRAVFPNTKGILRHGETGNILMPTYYKKAVIIPQGATFDILDKKFVYIVTANNKVEARQIEIAQELKHIYILKSGIKEGEKILIDGLRKVKNNDVVKTTYVSPEKVIGDLQQLHAE